MNDDTLTKLLPWGPPSWKICPWHAPRIPRYFAKFREKFSRFVLTERPLPWDFAKFRAKCYGRTHAKFPPSRTNINNAAVEVALFFSGATSLKHQSVLEKVPIENTDAQFLARYPAPCWCLAPKVLAERLRWGIFNAIRPVVNFQLSNEKKRRSVDELGVCCRADVICIISCSNGDCTGYSSCDTPVCYFIRPGAPSSMVRRDRRHTCCQINHLPVASRADACSTQVDTQ